MLRYIVTVTVLTYVAALGDKETDPQAIVVLTGDNVKGKVIFTQIGKEVTVEGEITGLTKGLHGFHIHALGDLSDGCKSTGSHFNPEKKNHGAPSAKERHVGDLGNIEANDSKVAKVSMKDSIISLDGVNSIIGRAVVVHSGEDDLGLGGHDDSLTTGHAGDRVACGIIGIL